MELDSVRGTLQDIGINGPVTLTDPAVYEMSKEGEIGNIIVANERDEITQVPANLDERVGNFILRATGGVNSDRYDVVLKDGTRLDPEKTLRSAGVGINGNVRLILRDSGIDSMIDSDSSSDRDSEITLQSIAESVETLKDEDINYMLEKEMNETGSILVTGSDGNLTELPVNKRDTVDDVIYKLTRTRDNEEYDLQEGAKVLPRAITLRDAGIPFGSRLRLTENPINVFIRTPEAGRNLTYEMRRSNTVRDLKQRFLDDRQVPIHQQRLQFQSKPLEDANTLASYGIKNNSHIESTYRLRGGAL